MQLAILNEDQEESPPESAFTQELIEWTLGESTQKKTVISTGFGMEGCALIELYGLHQKPLDVLYLDTGFFFQKTAELIKIMRDRHPHLNFIDRGTRLTPEEQAFHFGPELWKTNPDLCCQLRKVDPMRKALQDVEIWITGLRRDQSPSRAGIRELDWNAKYQVLRVCPLADWSRSQVRDFVTSRGVPYNPLHDQGYPSIGCTHCTHPVANVPVNGYSRAGRWRGMKKTECGLHT